MASAEALPKEFYERDPAVVARELLGKRLIRRLGDRVLEGIVVETEAYYGLKDPASRAYHGLKNYNRLMWGDPGRVFIYNVHNNWMFNVVAHQPHQIGAVLIRAIEPSKEIEAMKRNRNVEDVRDLTNGPGKLSKALRIDKLLNGVSVASEKSEILVAHNRTRFEIESSHRIGVRRDLERDLRFFIKGNDFVSKRRRNIKA